MCSILKRIGEHGGRVLHLVVNHKVSPQKIITVFFDRRAGRQLKMRLKVDKESGALYFRLSLFQIG